MAYTAKSFPPYLTSNIVNSLGPVKPSDADFDPLTQMDKDNGIVFGGADYAPKYYFRSVLIKGGVSGQTGKVLRTYYESGAYFDWPIEIATNGVMEVEGHFVGIDEANTTASLIFPCI